MKSEALFKRFGYFVNTLSGKYITAEDVGISPEDMVHVSSQTKHVAGLPGKSGDPSPLTAFGVYMGMKACAKIQFGNDSLENKIIGVQGVGHVGEVKPCEICIESQVVPVYVSRIYSTVEMHVLNSPRSIAAYIVKHRSVIKVEHS